MGGEESNSMSFSGLTQQILRFPLILYFYEFFKEFIISVMKTGPVPKHIGLIMDGNRRYAKKNQLALKDGHNAGAESLLEVLKTSFKLGISHVTIYAFSIENFNRSEEEVNTLFALLKQRLQQLANNDASYAMKNKVQIKIVGNKTMIPEDILKDLESIEHRTASADNKSTLNVCFPYTSRDDIASSMKKVVEKYKNNVLKSKEDISIQELNRNMYWGDGTPDLDILIRTSGHSRLSDFLLWQCNYNCIVKFVDTLWPDFKFFSIVLVLMQWGYFKTMQLEEQRVTGIKSEETKLAVRNILKELPSAPPFASISER